MTPAVCPYYGSGYRNELPSVIAEMAGIVDRVIAMDHAYLSDHPSSTLFAYWHGTPKPEILADRSLCEFWQKTEDEREERAAQTAGVYFEPTMLQTLLYPA